MSLQEEIDKTSQTIFRDSYQMSIGELINLYQNDEIDIHPEFQRVFRWSEPQKTKLIESIMLNIPIPPIFVSQNEEGVWDVIDGVQRLSTIFQFVGVFKDENDATLPPLRLLRTDYLPSFEGVRWENMDATDQDNADSEHLYFSKQQQLFFKRSRIDMVILRKDSDSNTKYELFQRLNTGGTSLSPQEVRNCLMIMTNKKFYEFILNLDKNNNFHKCLPITERKLDEQYRLELLLRLIIGCYIDWNNLSRYNDFAELLDKETLILCEAKFDYEVIEKNFNDTFALLNELLGEDSFRRYSDGKHTGPVLATAFQVIATGIYSNITTLQDIKEVSALKEKIVSLYSQDTFIQNMQQGVRAIPRFKELSTFGIEYFRDED